ncbi:proteasome beta subunit [methanogenic archaeon mixed culture ISO4-G1]|nr:proteasome beta subunit [methanogenic archaeon mixed culture ISO4-G1]
MTEDTLKTGTTTIGLKLKDGVILATDQRATMGNLIADNHCQKVFPLAENLGMTIAGGVGDAQLLIRYLQSEISIYKMKKGAPMSVQTAAVMIGNILRQGFYVAPLVGGYDASGGHIFSVDMAGGVLEDNYTSSGSGSVFALGSLEASYKPNMTKDEGINCAITALNSSRRRDNYSGDGFLVSYIGPKGYEEISREEIISRCEKLGFKYPN